MKSCPWSARCVALCVALAVAPGLAFAQGDRSGVRPEVISLPDGPGSIEGLGESFEPSPSSGTSAYGVSIRVPPGVAGFVPSPALRYSSGAGNGELGLGWSLGVPMVQRGTDEGLPRYDASDRIVLRGMQGRGAEDLVQLPDGSWRFRIESAFVRGRQRDDGSWEFRNRSGVRFRFGTSDAGTVRDGARVFAWCLTEQEDLRGHLIRYEYERDETGHPYLSRIVYNDFSPEVRNEVVFEYEDRPDRVTSYLPTFADTIARRVARIVVQHGGQLVRRYDLGYSMMLGLSRLVTVRMVGTDGVTALPTLTMGYVDFDPSAAGVVTMERAPARALGTVAEIDDVDGDALPDLLVTDPGLDGGRYSWIPNLDGASWGERQVMGESPSVWLSSSSVQLADMDGDGAADVLARVSPTSDGLRYYPATEGGFGAPVVIRPGPTGGFEDPDVRLVDLDHDKRTDWMRIDPTTGEVWAAFNEGEGAFTAATSMGRLDPSEVVSFSRSRLQLADANGDGLADLVLVRSGSARYWPSLGRGVFGEAVLLPGAPTLPDGELAGLQVRDLNGDGTADLVHVGVSRVRYWLNLAGTVLMAAMTIDDTPELRPTTVVRLADMNGNGTADIVWIDSASSTPWRYLDVLPRGTPGLLERIDNGLGRVTTIEYAGMGEMRRWAREQSIEWTRRSPIGQTVLRRVSMDTGLDPTVVYELRYADGYFDGEHREFRGFGRALRLDLGDEEQPTLVTDMRFDVGDIDEALKGFSLESERRDETGGVFDRAVSTYTVRTVDMATSGEEVRYAYQSRQETFVFELGADATVLRSEWEHDDYGNVVRAADYGIVQGEDVSAGDDETVTTRTYAIDRSRWIVDRVATEHTQSPSGERAAERRTYYDGPPFEGLPLGEFGAYGEVTRVESWIEADRFATESSYERDGHGNTRVAIGPHGGRREYERDAASHTFVEAERVIAPDTVLEFHATHDQRLGTLLSLTDPNGHTSHVRYDALGRTAALIEPGDTEAFPTQTWEYVFAAPASYIRGEQREESGQGGTIVSFTFVDGIGRERGHYVEAPGGRWVVSSLAAFGPRGLQSFFPRSSFERSADLVDPDDGRSGVRKSYDATGRAVRELEPDGSERRMAYAPLEVIAYDEHDTDPTSEHYDTPTRRLLDGQERIRGLVELDGSREVASEYRYDTLGNLTWMRDAEGRERRYAFDGRSRRTIVDDPNAGLWRFEYDDGDSLVRRVDPTGNEVRWDIDALGRTVTESHLRSGETEARPSVRYHYDFTSQDHPEQGNLRGQLAWVEDDAGAVFMGYDAHGRVASRTRRFRDGAEFTTWTDFDAVGRAVRRGYPDGSHLSVEYDTRGFIERVPGVIDDAEWNAAGLLEQLSLANGLVTEREYDARERLTDIRARSASGEVLLDVHHELDRSSRITSMIDRRPDPGATSLSATFAYDDRYRLVGTDAIGGATAWAYDDVGNLLSVTSARSEPHLNGTATYEGAGPDQMTQFAGETFVYDDAGRVTEDGARRYEYDARGRLERVTRGEVVEEYVYGYDGARAIKSVARNGTTSSQTFYVDRDVEVRNGGVVRYVFLGDERLVRLDPTRGEPSSPGANVSLARSLTWWLLALAGLAFALLVRRVPRRRMGAAALVALFAFGCLGGPRDPRASSVHVDAWPAGAIAYLSDHQGSPIVLVGADGEALERSARDPYGSFRASVGDSGEPYGYVGNEVDADSGLSDFGARPYRPDLGRFLGVEPRLVDDSPSPAALHEWQAYSYSAADPVSHIDADGRNPLLVIAIIVLLPVLMSGPDVAEPVQTAAAVATGDPRAIVTTALPYMMSGSDVAAPVQQAAGTVMMCQMAAQSASSLMSEPAPSGPASSSGSRPAATTTSSSGTSPRPRIRPATEQPRGGGGRVLRDGEGATPAEVAASTGGPTGGSRAGQRAARQRLLDETPPGEDHSCWRCGQTSSDPRDMHLGHRNVPTSRGGNLSDANICLEGAACNLSAGARGAPSPGMSCAERGSCGAPYGR